MYVTVLLKQTHLTRSLSLSSDKDTSGRSFGQAGMCIYIYASIYICTNNFKLVYIYMHMNV